MRSWNIVKYKQSEKRRTTGRRWMELRHRVLVEQPVCQICERKPAVEVDHIRPLAKGGTDISTNLQGLCKECHDIKTRKEFGIKEVRKIGADGYPQIERVRHEKVFNYIPKSRQG